MQETEVYPWEVLDFFSNFFHMNKTFKTWGIKSLWSYHLLLRQNVEEYGLNSRNQPSLVIDHLGLAFWLLAYGVVAYLKESSYYEFKVSRDKDKVIQKV